MCQSLNCCLSVCLSVFFFQIIEAYKRVFEAKQKRRPLSKHERTEIFRLAEEQKKLSDQLEAMPIPGFNYAVGTATTTKTTATGTAPSTAAMGTTVVTTTPASNTSKA